MDWLSTVSTSLTQFMLIIIERLWKEGMAIWQAGPVSPCNRNVEIKLKGRQASNDEHELLRWLNSKKPNSVGFACFGGTGELEFSLVMEIAIGL
ncbi:hypothetical protein NC651_017507 [Populus alba x Populus x berolinensis]|nr:hypothetical protein NC651_017507 [Populus alba x Populus x berolinensis]